MRAVCVMKSRKDGEGGDRETPEEASLVQSPTSPAPRTRSLHVDSVCRSVGCCGLKSDVSAPPASPAPDTWQVSSVLVTSLPLSLSSQKSCFPGNNCCCFLLPLTGQSVSPLSTYSALTKCWALWEADTAPPQQRGGTARTPLEEIRL